jgi:hypothetical protein
LIGEKLLLLLPHLFHELLVGIQVKAFAVPTILAISPIAQDRVLDQNACQNK